VVACSFGLLAVLPAFTWVSQRQGDAAAYAFSQGDCGAARRSALSSISILGTRAEPYEIVAYCDVRLGMSQAALKPVQMAVKLDPGNWNYRYDLALVRAAAGLDPRKAATQALTLDPREPLVQAEWKLFRSGNRRRWRSEAENIASSFTTL